MIKRINAVGLCEKCVRLVKPYYIVRKKVLCFKHLNEKEKEEVRKYDELKKLIEEKKKELERKKELLDYVKRAYEKGFEDGRKSVLKSC